jgi:hypothetical protein
MPLFQCRKCGCADDTALCHYWSARLRENEPLCSACDPTVAKWHGEFPRESFDLRHQREMERWLELSWVQPQEGPEIVFVPLVDHPTAPPAVQLRLSDAAKVTWDQGADG